MSVILKLPSGTAAKGSVCHSVVEERVQHTLNSRPCGNIALHIFDDSPIQLISLLVEAP